MPNWTQIYVRGHVLRQIEERFNVHSKEEILEILLSTLRSARIGETKLVNLETGVCLPIKTDCLGKVLILMTAYPLEMFIAYNVWGHSKFNGFAVQDLSGLPLIFKNVDLKKNNIIEPRGKSLLSKKA